MIQGLPTQTSKMLSEKNTALVYIITCAAIAGSILLTICLVQKQSRKGQPYVDQFEPTFMQLIGPRKFVLKELKKATHRTSVRAIS